MGHKGLRNNGKNNCFLNVVIQAFWHMDPFRKALQAVKLTNSGTTPCLTDALKVGPPGCVACAAYVPCCAS